MELINCFEDCKRLIVGLKGAKIKKVINKFNPFGDNQFYLVEHLLGNYKQHYVIQVEDKIIDPFLICEIPISLYLKKVYRNAEDLKLI